MKEENGNKNNLDHLIRAKLEHLQPQAPLGSWEQLEQRLDKAERAEAFDETVAERVQSIRVPYQSSSWAKLAARLELERQRFRAVLHYKGMELSLLLLLAMAVWQYLPNGLSAPLTPPIASNMEVPVAPSSDDISAISSNLDEESAVVVGTLEPSDAPLATLPSVIESPVTPMTPLADELHLEPVNPSRGNITTPPTLPVASPAPVADLSTSETGQLASLQEEQSKDFITDVARLREMDVLRELSDEEIDLLDYEDGEGMLDYLRPTRRKTFLRVGFVGSPDINRVITPDQRLSLEDWPANISEDRIEEFERISYGYTAGITLGVEFNGKWEVETGVLYSQRAFETVDIRVLFGRLGKYSKFGLDRIELNTVTTPLNLRYNAFLKDKWRVYVQGGASLNLILSANSYAAHEPNFARLNPRIDANSNSNSNTGAAFFQKDWLTDGWLEGGNFWENATIYADLAVGVERYISPHLSVFIQPGYRHALPLPTEQRIGPYGDKIHNFSLGTGVKIRL